MYVGIVWNKMSEFTNTLMKIKYIHALIVKIHYY